MGSSSNLCWHSGQILGTIPPSTPYEDNLNGYHLMYGVDVHGASPLVEGLTIFTGGDGITFDAAGDANWTVRDVHMTYIRDDCIENDFLNSGLVDRSFFDGCYDFMSARAYGAGAPDGSANTVTVQNSLIRVQAMDKLYPGVPTPAYGGFWKWSGSGSPNTDIGPSLVITNTVFRADAPPVEGNGAGLYMAPVPGKLKSCANNVMVWLGPGSFPQPLPSCFTVLTGQAGRGYWDNAPAPGEGAHPPPGDKAPPLGCLWAPGLSGPGPPKGTATPVGTRGDDHATRASNGVPKAVIGRAATLIVVVTSAGLVGAGVPSPRASGGAGGCLTRAGPTIPMTALQQRRFNNTNLAESTKVDASTAQFVTPGNIAIFIGGGPGICFHGGEIVGQLPPSTPYKKMHDTYGMVVHGASFQLQDLQVFDYGDGVSMDANGDATWSVRDVHFKYMRDDCVENDFVNSGTIENSLFDGCYEGFSARPYTKPTQDGSNNLGVVRNSLFRLH